VTLLGRPEREVWLMPLGALLDQWEVYRQYEGIAHVKKELSIEDVVPSFL
jgi:hypothetical protein